MSPSLHFINGIPEVRYLFQLCFCWGFGGFDFRKHGEGLFVRQPRRIRYLFLLQFGWRLETRGYGFTQFHKIGFWLPSFLVFKSTLYNIGRIEGFPRYKVPQVCRSIFFAFVKANAYFRAFVEVCKSARGWVLVSSQKAREKCWHGVNFGFGKTTLLPLHRATLPPVGNGIIFEFLFRPKESWRVRRGSNPKPAL